MRVEKIRRELDRIFQELDRAFEPALLLFLESLLVILHGLLRKILSHLTDVDDIGICRVLACGPIPQKEGGLGQENRDSVVAEVIENLDQLANGLVPLD